MALVFFFCFGVIRGFSQCNCTILFSVGKDYRITPGDVRGNYTVIGASDRITVEFDTLFRDSEPIEIPFKIINHSDTPLVVKGITWGSEAVSVRYQNTHLRKKDTLNGSYKTTYSLNRRKKWFTKISTIKPTKEIGLCIL